jgi:hypothetical protein
VPSGREFTLSVKKQKASNGRELDVPDGIIAHLTKEWGGNVHDQNVVEMTSSRPIVASPNYPAQRVPDLEAMTYF